MTLILLVTSLAWADAIGMPPDDCPEGSVGRSSHCGEVCVPTHCDLSASQCRAEAPVCEAGVGVCVEKQLQDESCGRMPTGPANPMVEVQIARGSCKEPADCGPGQECIVIARCVKPAIASRLCPLAASVPFGLALLGLASFRRSS